MASRFSYNHLWDCNKVGVGEGGRQRCRIKVTERFICKPSLIPTISGYFRVDNVNVDYLGDRYCEFIERSE